MDGGEGGKRNGRNGRNGRDGQRDIQRRLMDKHILVMGAGYVGLPLIKNLRNEGYRVHTTTTSPERVESLRLAANDVTLLTPNDSTPLKRALEWCDVLVVLVAPVRGATYEDTYLKTAKEIVKLTKERERPLYILYTGSTSVYEGVSGDWCTEDMSLAPISEKGKILLETEKTFLNSGFDACVLRLGGIFGPGRDLQKRTHYFSGKKQESSGDEWTNHIHLDDILTTISFCIRNKLRGIYNVVNDDHPTRKELYGDLCEQLQIPKPIWNDHNENQSRGYKVSNEKIKGNFTNLLLDQGLYGQKLKPSALFQKI